LIVFAFAGDSTMTNERPMVSFVTEESASGRISRAVCVVLATLIYAAR
jgi:hypothetical protein